MQNGFNAQNNLSVKINILAGVYDLENTFLRGYKFTNGINSGSLKYLQGKPNDKKVSSLDSDADSSNCTYWYWVVYDTNTGEIYSIPMWQVLLKM